LRESALQLLKNQLQPLHGQRSPDHGGISRARHISSRSLLFNPEYREACEDYIEVFFSHARLHVFADKYDVGSLKDLSLHKLQRTLSEFTLYNERIEDIVNLLRYSYSNTTGRLESVNGLRLLVVYYSACVVEDLSQSKEFQLLLQEVGLLARDLVEQMLQRLD